MVAYVGLFPDLPVIAHDAIRVFRAFEAGEASAEQLEQMRVKCWEYLDSHHVSTDLSDPVVRIVRALICALYVASPDSEISELLAWFICLLPKVKGTPTDAVGFFESYFHDFKT
jgi:hypothetical protein